MNHAEEGTNETHISYFHTTVYDGFSVIFAHWLFVSQGKMPLSDAFRVNIPGSIHEKVQK